MKLRYLGTGASEGIPAVFCNCPVCKEARTKKGRHIRTRSQAIIDNELLIDFGADSYAHSLNFDIDFSKIQNLVVTHVHQDHYYPCELLNRQIGLAKDMDTPTLLVYGSEDIQTSAYKQWQAIGKDDVLERQNRVKFCFFKPYETKKIQDFFVTAIPATHTTTHPYIYAIEKGGKSMLYFNDSGYLSTEAMAFLKQKGFVFDLVSYDCTWGAKDAGLDDALGSHMGLPNNIIARNRFIENGNYKENTISVITHFSHNIPKCGYDDMLGVAKDNGFLLAYDGMEIEF